LSNIILQENAERIKKCVAKYLNNAYYRKANP
jgi:hypothetical protein